MKYIIMKYNFNTPFLDMDGNETGRSLMDVVRECLLLPIQDESPNDKFEAYVLAQKFTGTPESFTLDLDQARFIKDRIGRIGSPLVVGQVWTLLEGKEFN